MPRDLTVRVKADVGAYRKAMSAAVAATDELAQSGLRLQRMGMQISDVGDKLTKNVTLPLALVGGAAVKMANDFDKSFTQMQTLAGVSGDAVDGLKESVLGLSGETGRAPQELAEALYFLQSSGLDSAEAMEALEVSAKASAVGLGDTATIADAVSSAMLAYAQSGLEAAEATDILIATARAGKAEPAELAGQMGRLLPIASELGITFGDVGGAIAALSTKGNNAEQATTQLVNVMGKLLKPSEQAVKLLDSVGVSTDTIRESIAERGLLGTLETLKSALGDSGFVKFFEDQQAVQGALSLLGGDLNKTRDIFEQVNSAVGDTDEAFATWAESMGAKNARAFADFQVALIQLGDALAPIAADLLTFASGIAEAFSGLPKGAQTAIIAVGALMAALGPLMSVGGRVITMFGTVLRMLESFALPAGTVSKSFRDVSGTFNSAAASTSRLATAIATGLVTALTAAGAALELYNQQQQQNNISRMTREFLAAGTSVEKMRDVMHTLVSQGPAELAGVFGELAQTNREAAQRFIETAEAAGFSEGMLDNMRHTLESTADAEAQTATDIGMTTGAIDDQAAATANATTALEAYADALAAQFDPLFGMQSALRANEDAQIALAEAQTALNDAMDGGKAEEVAEAQRNYEAALDKSSGTLLDVQQAQLTLNAAIEKGEVSVADAQQTLYNWAIAAGYTEAQALEMAGSLGSAADAAIWLGAQDPVVSVSTTGRTQTEADLNAIKAKTDAIPREINIFSRVQSIVTGATSIPQRARGGPVERGRAYIVGENQPELFIPDRPGTIWPSVPSTVPSPIGVGGGGTIALTVQVNNPIVASEREFQRMVISAANQALASGEINLRGRRIT